MNFTLQPDETGVVDVIYNGDIPYTCLTATAADELAAFFQALPEHLRPDPLPTLEPDFDWHAVSGEIERAQAAAGRLVDYLTSREPAGRR